MPQLTKTELDNLLSMKLDRLFSKWIHRLRLKDWDITWRVVRTDSIGKDRSGKCSSLLMKKIASIEILHPDDAPDEWVDPYDLEVTVVHELLHLHFDPWSQFIGEDDQALVFLEQTVHLMSTTLVAADRGNRHWANFPEFCSVQDPGFMVR